MLKRVQRLLNKTLSLHIGQDLLERNDFNCYCQHKNGMDGRNNIMCGLVEIKNGTVGGDFTDIIKCKYDEWCTGPSEIDKAIQGSNYGKNLLCTKGKL